MGSSCSAGWLTRQALPETTARGTKQARTGVGSFDKTVSLTSSAVDIRVADVQKKVAKSPMRTKSPSNNEHAQSSNYNVVQNQPRPEPIGSHDEPVITVEDSPDIKSNDITPGAESCPPSHPSLPVEEPTLLQEPLLLQDTISSPVMPEGDSTSPVTQFLPHITERSRSLLQGKVADLDFEPDRQRWITLYICSYNTDIQDEVAYVVDRLSGTMSHKCAERGFGFNLVDIHRDISRYHGDSKDALLWHLQECVIYSTALFALAFLSDTARPNLPVSIQEQDFEELTNGNEHHDLVSKCYMKDDTCVPSMYRLIHTDFLKSRENHSGESQIITFPNDSAITLAVQPCTPTDADSQDETDGNNDDRPDNTVVANGVDKLFYGEISQTHREKYFISLIEDEITTLGNMDNFTSKTVIIDCGRAEEQPSQTTDSWRERNMYDRNTHWKTSVRPENLLKLDIFPKMPSDKLDANVVKTQEAVFDMFCESLERTCLGLIDDALDGSGETPPAALGRDRQYDEISTQLRFCKDSAKTFYGRQNLIAEIKQYVTSTIATPLVLRGPIGCGKTFLLAKTVTLCHSWMPSDCSLVVRLSGLTKNSSSLELLLHSICEQLGTMYEYSSHKTYELISRSRYIFNEQLRHITATSSHPVTIIIDSADQLPDWNASCDWLPTELPPNVKLIMTIGDKTTFQASEAQFLDIPVLSADETIKFLRNMLQSHGREMSPSFEATLASSLSTEMYSLVHTAIISTIVSQWHMRSDTLSDKANCHAFTSCSNTEECFDKFMRGLEDRFGTIATVFSLGYLSTSHYGITEYEMLYHLSNSEMKNKFKYGKIPDSMAKSLWIMVQYSLRSFLETVVIFGNVLYRIRSQEFKQHCIRFCQSVMTDKKYFQTSLYHYYTARCFIMDSSATLAVPERVLFCRKAMELPYLTYGSQAQDTFIDSYIFNVDWINFKLQYTDVFCLLDDLVLLNEQNICADIGIFYKSLLASSEALSVDHGQIYTQLRYRLRDCVNWKDSSFCPLLSRLLSAYSKSRTNLFVSCPELCINLYCPNNMETNAQDASPTRLVTFNATVDHFVENIITIKDDIQHVITVSPSKGELVLWNISSMKRIRMLKGLTEPRTVQMFDFQRAAILCGREIRIYNLDSLTFESQIKGVLNVNMPYYGIHDNNHVIMLSRNRMSVNIMNVHTSEMTATFKTGEDRFLNSLVVSGNGNVVVCGEETDKFRILVWSLVEKKLKHDIRINQHFFLPGLCTISHDGTTIICGCKELGSDSPNFLVVYDLRTGQLFKKWKPVCDTCCLTMSSSQQLVIVGLTNGNLLVWDLIAGSVLHRIQGIGLAADKLWLAESGERCVTLTHTGHVTTLCLWDLEQGSLLSTFTPDVAITCCQISPDGYTVIIGLEGTSDIVTLRLCSADENQTQLHGYGDPSREGGILECDIDQ